MRHPLSFLLILCLACLHVQGQTTVRSFDLVGGATYITHDAATGGLLMVGRDATLAPVFLRLDAAGQTMSSRVLDPGLSVGVEAIRPLVGGGYVLIGYGGASATRALVMRLDSTGQPSSARNYIREQLAGWLDVVPTADGGAVVAGSGFNHLYDAFGIIARLDAQLDTVWTRVLPYSIGELTATRVAILPSGNLIVVGSRASLGNTDYRLCIHKLTALGDWLWSKEYTMGGGWWQNPRELIYDGQDRLSIAAELQNPTTSQWAIGRTLLDTAGNFIRMDSMGVGRSPQIRGIGVGHNGEFLVAGSWYEGSSNQVGFNLAISSSDSLLWANRFEIGGTGMLIKVLPASNGGYWWTAADSGRTYLLHSDAQGALADSCGTSPLATQAGPVSVTTTMIQPGLASGLTETILAPSTSPFSVVNQLECLVTGLPNPAQGQHTLVYPQPMRTSARIRLPGAGRDGLQLLLHDLGGKTMLPPVTPTSEGLEFQRGDLPAGLYGYQVLQAGRRIASGKLLVAD